MSTPELSIVGTDQPSSTYVRWQFKKPTPGPVKVYSIEPQRIRDSAVMLSSALPIRQPGETDETLMRRVLSDGVFADRGREEELAQHLSELLLPPDLVDAIRSAYLVNGREPILITLEPSPSTAQFPWELLSLQIPDARGNDHEVRLIEVADIVYEVVRGLHAGRARNPVEWSVASQTSPLYVIDPISNVRHLGSVLYDTGHDAFRRRVSEAGHQASSVDDDFTRRNLHLALNEAPPPGRLVFVGHVVMSEDTPGATALVLSDPREMFGVTAAIDASNRPLSALDLLEGTKNSTRRAREVVESEKLAQAALSWPADRGLKQDGAEIWPMPPRVILVACNSGDDLRNPEPFGLATAIINAGAVLVTATKWTLPADRAFREIGKATNFPLLDSALVLDDAHSMDDPVAAIASWQRQQLAEWRSTGRIASSPILWAAYSNYSGSVRDVDVYAAPQQDYLDDEGLAEGMRHD